MNNTDGTIYLASTSVTFNSSANNCLCKARGVVFEKTTADEPAIASYMTYDVVI